MRPRHGLERQACGGILIGAVIVLVLLAVFAVTTAAAYSAGLQAYAVSADSTSALYAADTGIEIALKEYLEGNDRDRDGTIGGVSDDGDARNDPRLDAAYITVHCADGVMTATGTCGAAARRIEVTLR